MRIITATLAALSVAAALIAPAATAAPTAKKKHIAKSHRGSPAYRSNPDRAGSTPTYQESISEKRPFGSTSWWDQMDREGRGGQSSNN